MDKASLTDCSDDGYTEEDEQSYDALNDETFGADITTDWEDDHEKLAQLTEESRKGACLNKSDNALNAENRFLSSRMIELVLDDSDQEYAEEDNKVIKRIAAKQEETMGIGWSNKLKIPVNRTGPKANSEEYAGPLADQNHGTWSHNQNIHPRENRLQKKHGRNNEQNKGNVFYWLSEKLAVTNENKKIGTPDLKNVPTVSEIEMRMIKESAVKHVVNGKRCVRSVEDIERAMVKKVQRSEITNIPQIPLPPRVFIPEMCFKIPPPGMAMPPGIIRLPPVVASMYMPTHQRPSFLAMQQRHRYPPPPNQPIAPNHNWQRRSGPEHLSQAYHQPRNQENRQSRTITFMTQREREWLCKVQMMQLKSCDPFHDDYYNVNYQMKHGVEPPKQAFSKDQAYQTKSNYTPLQFEKSLGKLQAGSVTAPRKIIDCNVVENTNGSINSAEGTTHGPTHNLKRLLLAIEDLFSLLIRAQEFMQGDQTLVVCWLSQIVENILKIGVTNILRVQKGTNLLDRVSKVLHVRQQLGDQEALLNGMLQELPMIVRKIPFERQLIFLPSIKSYLGSVSLDTLVKVASYFENKLEVCVTNMIFMTVITLMIERAENELSCAKGTTCSIEMWFEFLKVLANTAANQPTSELAILACPETSVLNRHLMRITALRDTNQLATLKLMFNIKH